MAGNLKGADLEQLDHLAVLLGRRGSQLTLLTSTATGQITASVQLWNGPDASGFRQQWTDVHRPKLVMAAQSLTEAADIIARNRAQQEHTSAIDAAEPNGSTAGTTSDGATGDSDNVIVGNIADFVFGDIANFWNGGQDGFPIGSIGAALLKAPRIAQGQLPLFNTGLVGKKVAGSLASKPGTLGKTGVWLESAGATKIFKGVGVAGGVVSTGLGAYDLYQQGNPIDALEREGAGYVADVAGTAFSASMTAFLLVPSPLTTPVLAGVVLGTGAVWIGAEVVDNWDEISDFASDSWDTGSAAVGDTWKFGTEFVGERVDFVGDVGGDVVSAISDWF